MIEYSEHITLQVISEECERNFHLKHYLLIYFFQVWVEWFPALNVCTPQNKTEVTVTHKNFLTSSDSYEENSESFQSFQDL